VWALVILSAFIYAGPDLLLFVWSGGAGIAYSGIIGGACALVMHRLGGQSRAIAMTLLAIMFATPLFLILPVLGTRIDFGPVIFARVIWFAAATGFLAIARYHFAKQERADMANRDQ
jgi:hypothetical protein